MTDEFHGGRPTFVGLTGLEITETSSEHCVGRLKVNETHHQPYGLVHGGVYATIVETLASTGAAFWAVEHGYAGVVGVSNSTDFFRATKDGVLIGEATPIQRGRTYQLWQVDIVREEDGKLAARGQVRLHNVKSINL